jgi:uncharacterized membrane protein
MPFVGLLLGAIVGVWIDDSFEFAAAGAFVGFIAGLVYVAWRKRGAMSGAGTPPAAVGAAPAAGALARLDAIEQRLACLETALERAGIALTRPAAAALPPQPMVVQPLARAQAAPAPPGAAAEVAASRSADDTFAAPPFPGAVPPMPPYGVRVPGRPNALWAWITGGNTLARVGIVVLFIGVGFLLKYASERFTVPNELRVAGVAVGGIALLMLGWRLRVQRAGYAMILQGGGVGVLYLTVFAALRLYALLPPLAAFGLLFWIAALSSWLAVRQDAMALAAVGVVGGFLAPILTSTDAGNHVLLFSYYALLNAGIVAIAWFKAWRLLNLLGFVMTFVIGTLWGVTRYRSEDFATTEPFLVLFFLFYVAIAVLYALRRSVEVRRYVDGTLVFGTPLVAAGLQYALVRRFELGMAFSAVAASALYLALARVLWARRRDDLRLLVESFLALGVAFATLAVPFAFDARWTSATWALEGAAIVWVGARQQRLPVRLFGLALQLAAGVAFGLGTLTWTVRPPVAAWPVLNSEFVGATLIAGAGLLSARLLHLHRDALRELERALVPAAFAWGVVWWLVAGGREIERWIAPQAQLAVAVALLAGTALAFAFAARELRWPLARGPVYAMLPALLAIAVVGAAHGTRTGHLFGHGGALAWPFAVAVWIALVRSLERMELMRALKRPDADSPGDLVAQLGHAGLAWLLAVLAAHESAWLAATFVGPRGAWAHVPWGLVPALAVLAICALASRTLWPVAANRRAYLVTAAVPLVVWMLAWSLFANVESDGDPAPLPYVPLLNPLDLALGFVAAAIALWLVCLRNDRIDLASRVPRAALLGVPAALVFVWANAIVLRTIHHWHGVGWSLGALWRSMLVQASLSLLWSAIALATMVVAHRRGARTGWIAGAALLAVVVVKLFVVDLSRVSGIERIVSFIGVGVLLLAIGYLAPVPPRRNEATP